VVEFLVVVTRGERTLRATAVDFAARNALELRTRWTTTGLEVEFVEPGGKDKARRFMRCTLGRLEVAQFSNLDADLVRVQWHEAWTRQATS